MDPGNLPNHVVILTKHSELLRTTLADGIENVARELYGSFVVMDYQLNKILKTAARRPKNGVSELIAIIKGSEDHFDKFIQCLNDMGYTGLVQKLQGTGRAAVGTTDKDAADKQQIEKARTLKNDKNGAKKLVNILGFRGENALPRIIEALKSINHDAAKFLQAKINDFKKQKCEKMDTTPVKYRRKMDPGTGSAAVETTEEGSEEMEEYEEIDPSDFMQCDVDGVTGCDIDFVRDKFGQGTKFVYPMRKEKRGICLIINNYFYPKTSNKYRRGTEKDVEALKVLFKELEFVVQLEEELSASKIIKMLESCRLEINSSDDMPDCFILFILTHGKEGCVQGTDGKFVDITKIRDCFDYNNCPKLQGTPKLFFIQACQGTRTEYMEVQTDTVASIEDYYLAIATSPGFVSYRHRQHGSWFVQAIVATCKTYACKESFQKMMERIAQEMRNVGSNRKKYEMKRIKKNTRPKRIVNIATPCFENELKKDLFFFPKSGTDLV